MDLLSRSRFSNETAGKVHLCWRWICHSQSITATCPVLLAIDNLWAFWDNSWGCVPVLFTGIGCIASEIGREEYVRQELSRYSQTENKTEIGQVCVTPYKLKLICLSIKSSLSNCWHQGSQTKHFTVYQLSVGRIFAHGRAFFFPFFFNLSRNQLRSAWFLTGNVTGFCNCARINRFQQGLWCGDVLVKQTHRSLFLMLSVCALSQEKSGEREMKQEHKMHFTWHCIPPRSREALRAHSSSLDGAPVNSLKQHCLKWHLSLGLSIRFLSDSATSTLLSVYAIHG